MPDTSQKIKLSIVATIYRAEKIVPDLVAEITKYVAPLNIPYEIILVNDNSPDNSEQVIEKEAAMDPHVKGLTLARNFGQQIAMSVGMRYASGDYVVIMDGDMQNPPALIPELLRKINEGFDIIYCVSKSRNNFFNAITSRFFWFVIIKLFKVRIIKNQLMMKIMTNRFAQEFNRYNEINRTVSGIVQDIGMKYDIIEVENQKRHSGKSNYNFIKRFNLMIDVVISLSTAPLNFMIYLGFIIFVLTTGAALYYVYQYFVNDITPGFTSIMLALFFFGSIIILMLGFIGRYLANIYGEVRNRPLYIVRKLINIQND